MANRIVRRRFDGLPPELINAVGEVALRAGQVEHILALTIHRTTGTAYDKAFAVVFDRQGRKEINKEVRQSFRDRAIADLGDTKGNEYADVFDKLIDDWYELAGLRDNIVHCCWTLGHDDDNLVGNLTRTGKPLIWGGSVVGIDHVKKLADDLTDLRTRLNAATKSGEATGGEDTVIAAPDEYISSEGLNTTASAAVADDLSLHLPENSKKR